MIAYAGVKVTPADSTSGERLIPGRTDAAAGRDDSREAVATVLIPNSVG